MYCYPIPRRCSRGMFQITMYQIGFAKNCGDTKAIHIMLLLMEKYPQKHRSLYIVFLDLEKAFLRVSYKLIWYSMRIVAELSFTATQTVALLSSREYSLPIPFCSYHLYYHTRHPMPSSLYPVSSDLEQLV